MVKTLEPYIKKAFSDLGFSDDEIKNGCWLLEKAFRKGEEKKPIAWIAYHKFLERVADKAHIVFEKPEVMNCQENEIALYVNGKTGDKTAWSIGEASSKNCTNDYRWAMAEKRAKDRVILKLLGVAGDMYSEEEADEFKRFEEQQGVQEIKNEVKADKAKETRELNKKVAEYNKSDEGLEMRYKNMYILIRGMKQIDQYNKDKVLMGKVSDLLNELYEAQKTEAYEALNKLVNEKMLKTEPDEIPDDICQKGITPADYLNAG